LSSCQKPIFKDAAQRSRQKRIEGTNRLKDEHDRLRVMYQEAKRELETIDKENDAIRHAIRQKTEERDEYVANRAKRTRITRN